METILMDLVAAAAPSVISALGKYPFVQTILTDVIGSLMVTTNPAAPPPPAGTGIAGQQKKSAFVQSVQAWLNKNAPPSDGLLVEDGWLGKKTEKGIIEFLASKGINL